jgi:hypothetical protein
MVISYGLGLVLPLQVGVVEAWRRSWTRRYARLRASSGGLVLGGEDSKLST